MTQINISPKKQRKKIWIIFVSLIFGLAIGAAGFVAYKQYFAPENPKNTNAKPTPEENTEVSMLDGTKAAQSKANRRPLAVIVENQTQARPLFGLDKASIMYEAITEGGITRFMAIYGPNEAEKVGPVRSLRTFFLDWAWEYNAFIGHVGGNIDALDRVKEEKAFDLDQFAVGDTAYWRIIEAGKALEHTMYTNIKLLYNVAEGKRWDMKADFTALKFHDPKKFKVNPQTNQEISIDFSSPQYAVSYNFDPINNNYPRIMNGTPHKDGATGNQLSPVNLIIQEVSRTEGTTRINENSWAMKTIGEGKAYVIFGGQKIDATWKKKDLKSRTMFYDSSGKEIQFLPGQFWYEIVPPEVFSKVEIKTETPTPTE